MAEISFEVKQDALAVIQNTAIEANFEECKAALAEMIAPYAALVIGPDDIASAKADRAKIRKIEAQIGDMRIAVKKAYMKPYDDFADKCTELVEICAKGSTNLDLQIKEFESAEADAKIAELKAYYESGDAETREYCPWERIYSDKWRNKGVSLDMAKGAIDGAFEIVSHDLAAIREMGGDDTTYLLDVYKQTHYLSAVILKASELKTAREREEQRRLAAQKAAQDLAHAKQAAQEMREEEERRKAAEHGDDLMSAIKQAAAESVATILENEAVVTIDFRVTGTKMQLNSLAKHMRNIGLKYGRVPTSGS